MRATHYFHKITLPGRRSRYSAWFAGDPDKPGAVLVDCERVDRLHRVFPCTEAEWTALRNGPWTARQGGTFNTAA